MITSFSGSHAFLSNFFIEPDHTHVEGEYQAAKCRVPADRQRFQGLPPAKAKALGRKVLLRKDWEAVKVEIMFELVKQKFIDHPVLRRWLLDTAPQELIEGNYWGDRFWGVYYGEGQNQLGKILMIVRGII